MRLRPSYYNHLVELNGELWGWQSRTGAVVRFDRSAWDIVSTSNLTEIAEQTAPMLNAGFLVAEDIDERLLVRHMLTAARYASDALDLVIAPTLACNMECVYCFERDVKPVFMTDAVANATVELIRQHQDRMRRLRVVWYGGEPLLDLDRIRSLSDTVRRSIARIPIQYQAMIITNGTLLTEDVAGKLQSWGVDTAQVTVDGSQQYHDRRRRLSSGQGTWELIMSNVAAAARYLNVVVRCTLSADAVEQVFDLCLELEQRQLPHTVKIMAAPLQEGRCDSACQAGAEFMSALLQAIVKRGSVPDRMVVPEAKSQGGCIGTRANSYVIDPYGDVHRCFETVGSRDRAVGNLLGGLAFNSCYQQWLETDPFVAGAQCVDCNLLPCCHGGCPLHVIATGKRQCTALQGSIREWIQCQQLMAEARGSCV